MKSGYAAIIGRPNVGKSTLLNALLGEKLSITTRKPQTTRWQILGIRQLEHPPAQIIYVDTPGIHRGEKNSINRYMNRIAASVIHDADVIVFMVDATVWEEEDDLVLQKLAATTKPVILLLNKIDLLESKSQLLPLIENLQEKFPFKHIIPISALEKENIEAVEKEIALLLPEGPALFPEDQKTDKNIRFRVAEIIREKVINATSQELPYVTAVTIEEFNDKREKSSKQKNLYRISAVIWVERPGQRVILIGKKGLMLKKIGTRARHDIERLLGEKVFLQLWVKVKEHWTDDEKAMKSLGYE